MVLAGFSFDAYTEIDRAAGVWISDGGTDQPGLQGVQVVLFSPRYVRDACRGILRVRVLSCEELRGIPVAGSVAVAFRTESKAPGDFLGSTRCSTRRGVLNGLARWRDEDESVFLYVPRGKVDPNDMNLTVEVQKRDIIDMKPLGVIGRATIPISRWGHGELREVRMQLQQAESSGEGALGPPSIINLQLQYDAFGKVGAATLEEGTEGGVLEVDGELLDDITPEKRERRRRYGSAVPYELEFADVKHLPERSLQERLRGRGLPCVGEGVETLRERLQKSLDAEANLKKEGGLWSTVEFVVGSDAKQRIEGALEMASAVSESLSGDLFGALGAGLVSGVKEVPGVKELMRGDFSGAMEQRRKIMEAASTDEGRQAIQRKVDGAMKRARQQAMLRLANGMELMSVRRGAWRMLERAVLEEGHGSFADYEALCYLEARATNTECWVWRYQPGKRLVVAFRGTSDFGDVLTDIAATPRDFGQYGKVHEGFLRAYESIREALIAALERGFGDEDRKEGGVGWEVLFTGHSLGGALATLASLDITLQSKYRGVVDDIGKNLDEELSADLGIPRSPLADAEIIACTFGAPRVGSARMCWLYDRVVPKAWRIYSSSDIIPTVPPTTLFGFRHAGIGVELDPASSELTARGRTPGLREAAEEERAEAERLEAAGREKEEPKRGGGDIWSSWNATDIAELRRVMGTGTQAVGEHMEDNYFARIQECLSAELRMKGEGEENFLL